MQGKSLTYPGKTLSHFLEEDINSFNLVRLVAALCVVLTHAYVLLGLGEFQPLKDSTPYTIGRHAVNLFFVLSGLMLTRSLDRKRLAEYFVDAHTYQYPLSILVFFNNATPPHGIFLDLPRPGQVNGSLWTIRYEVAAYLALAAGYAVGVFRTRLGTSLLLSAAGLAIAFVELIWMSAQDTPIESLARYSFSFLLGVNFYHWRSVVPTAWWTVLPTAIVTYAINKTGFEAPAFNPPMRSTGHHSRHSRFWNSQQVDEEDGYLLRHIHLRVASSTDHCGFVPEYGPFDVRLGIHVDRYAARLFVLAVRRAASIAAQIDRSPGPDIAPFSPWPKQAYRKQLATVQSRSNPGFQGLGFRPNSATSKELKEAASVPQTMTFRKLVTDLISVAILFAFLSGTLAVAHGTSFSCAAASSKLSATIADKTAALQSLDFRETGKFSANAADKEPTQLPVSADFTCCSPYCPAGTTLPLSTSLAAPIVRELVRSRSDLSPDNRMIDGLKRPPREIPEEYRHA